MTDKSINEVFTDAPIAQPEEPNILESSAEEAFLDMRLARIGLIAGRTVCAASILTAVGEADRAPNVAGKAIILAFFSLGVVRRAASLYSESKDRVSELQTEVQVAHEKSGLTPPEWTSDRRALRKRTMFPALRHVFGLEG